MKKKLSIHIGAGKCGSSAIQAYLGRNSVTLQKQGILVPGEKLDLESNCTGNQIWFFQNGISQPDFKSAVERRIRRLHTSMVENELDHLIVSAENLINPDGFCLLFSELKPLFDIEILAYVRRQDDYLISAWQQWYLKYFDTFEDYVCSMGDRVDWFRALESWRDMYGTENIKVRVFEKDKLVNGNVIEDFCHLLSIDMTHTQIVNERVNRSLDEKFNKVANKFRDELFESIHDNQFYQFLADIYGESAFKQYSGSTELTLSQRMMLVDKYWDSNERLREKYISESSIPLGVFKKPTDADCRQRPVDVFGDSELDYTLVGMFGMYKRLNKQLAAIDRPTVKNEVIEEIA